MDNSFKFLCRQSLVLWSNTVVHQLPIIREGMSSVFQFQYHQQVSHYYAKISLQKDPILWLLKLSINIITNMKDSWGTVYKFCYILKIAPYLCFEYGDHWILYSCSYYFHLQNCYCEEKKCQIILYYWTYAVIDFLTLKLFQHHQWV